MSNGTGVLKCMFVHRDKYDDIDLFAADPYVNIDIRNIERNINGWQ